MLSNLQHRTCAAQLCQAVAFATAWVHWCVVALIKAQAHQRGWGCYPVAVLLRVSGFKDQLILNPEYQGPQGLVLAVIAR